MSPLPLTTALSQMTDIRLLRAVGALRDQSEAVLPTAFWAVVEGMSEHAGHLEVATARNTQQRLLLIFTSDSP